MQFQVTVVIRSVVTVGFLVTLDQPMAATAVLVGLAAMLTHLLIAATVVLVALQQVAVQQVEASLQAQLVVMGEVPTTAARTGALVELLLADLRPSQVVMAALVGLQQAVT